MSRAKGSAKTGGRKAGTPNKATANLKAWVAEILESGKDSFISRLANLDDKEYIRAYMNLMGYVLPKMSPVTIEDILKKEREMLHELFLSMPDEALDRISLKMAELQTLEINENKIE